MANEFKIIGLKKPMILNLLSLCEGVILEFLGYNPNFTPNPWRKCG